MLIWPWRRRAVLRERIATAIVELHEYEREHIDRQRERVRQQQHRSGDHRKPKRPHGSYDLDQKREFVRVRVASLYRKPPRQLEQLVRDAFPDEIGA